MKIFYNKMNERLFVWNILILFHWREKNKAKQNKTIQILSVKSSQ